jgi:hypothetical protein
MSFDEINALINAKTKQNHEEWEQQRWNWFYILVSQGSKAEKPKDILIFPWEEEKVKQKKPLTKAQVDKRANQAKRWLNNR